jgi:transcriptional/translational regulatory protein YebC/TACO1
MFERKGAVSLKTAALSEDQEMALIEAGADDIIAEAADEDAPATVTVRCAPDGLARLREAAEQAGLAVEDATFEWVPKEKAAPVAPDVMEKAVELFNALEDDEDVSEIYTTV